MKSEELKFNKIGINFIKLLWKCLTKYVDIIFTKMLNLNGIFKYHRDFPVFSLKYRIVRIIFMLYIKFLMTYYIFMRNVNKGNVLENNLSIKFWKNVTRKLTFPIIMDKEIIYKYEQERLFTNKIESQKNLSLFEYYENYYFIKYLQILKWRMMC